MSEQQSKFERVLIVANPRSSQHRKLRGQLRQLDHHHKYIETSHEPERTRDHVTKNARDGDVVFVAGGDGTFHMVGNIGLSQPIVPIPFGHANDMRAMLTGKSSLSHILSHGELTSLHPMELTIEDERETRISRVFGYLGINGPGDAVVGMEQVKKTSGPIAQQTGWQVLREAVATGRALSTAKRYIAHDYTDQTCADEWGRVYANGNRMAIYGRPHASLVEPTFERIVSEQATALSTLTDMVQFARGKLAGTKMDRDVLKITTPQRGYIYGMQDGELLKIYNDSLVTIGIAETPYQTLTTQPIECSTQS